MRLLFVADGRSPIALNWIRQFADRGDEVFFASTFHCEIPFPVRGYRFTPVAYSRTKKGGGARGGAVKWRTALRDLLGPLTVRRASAALREYIRDVKPDLVHAMRIPFEGMLAADAYTGTPLLLSVWGNDFTLHARANPLIAHYTRWALSVADALHTDCRRDIRLAEEWGFPAGKPTLQMPGNGGIDLSIFHPPAEPVTAPIVVHARGSRAYVRNDVFFAAVPLVLSAVPKARFICAGLADDPSAHEYVRRYGLSGPVQLAPVMPRNELAPLFRSAAVMVSPTVHDGTPNSLLEGMACGCFPVAGDLESIQEWITDGANGLLVDATDPKSLAQGLIRALQNFELRKEAIALNMELIRGKADYATCMPRAVALYERLLGASRQA